MALIKDSELDHRKAARSERVITGTLPISDLPALEDRVLNSCIVEVSLKFGMYKQKHEMVEVTLTTDLVLACSRCIEPVTWTLNHHNEVLLVTDPDAYRQMNEDLYYIDGAKFNPVKFIEEELVLAIPFAVQHGNSCSISFEHGEYLEQPKILADIVADIG